MDIFSRLGSIIDSSISNLIDREESPEKMVRQVIIDMQRELAKATQNYGRAKASASLSDKKYQNALKVSQKWETEAKAALSQGNKELAEMAVIRKIKADEEVSAYKEMYDSMSVQMKSAEEQINEIKIKLDKAKNRQTLLAVRSGIADTKKNMAAITDSLDGSSAFENFKRMEEKIIHSESEADAFSAIAKSNKDDLKVSCENLEKDERAEAELSRFMAEMNIKENSEEE